MINSQVTPSIFGSRCTRLGSQHSRSPHGQFLVNIRACTCMYAITRTLPEFKSVSSSHVSRPLVRIAAAPGGLSRNRGADQVTRTTRVANAHSITSDPPWTAWRSRQTGGFESFNKNGHICCLPQVRDTLRQEMCWVSAFDIVCLCVPLCVTVYHCLSLCTTVCHCLSLCAPATASLYHPITGQITHPWGNGPPPFMSCEKECWKIPNQELWPFFEQFMAAVLQLHSLPSWTK